MPTIKYTREDITKIENERDKYKSERDSLIKDVEKLREKVDVLERENKRLLQKNNKLIATDIELIHYRTNYKILTEHIRLKALHNPSVSRYKDLMHFIDELEDSFND